MTSPQELDLQKINDILDSGGIHKITAADLTDKAHMQDLANKLIKRISGIRRRMALDSDHKIRSQRQAKLNAIYEVLDLFDALPN